MSGICGILDSDSRRSIQKQDIELMMDFLLCRGSDNQGIYLNKKVGLGASQLAICDSSLGEKPIYYNEKEDTILICDGEIYDSVDLRVDLEKKGHCFKGSGDLEALVHLYEEKGIDFLKDLRGAFSLALWDDRLKCLYLARDRIGTKPLYYFTSGSELIFASIPSAIFSCPEVPQEIDLLSLDCYLSFEYVVGEKCIFKNIKKLLPGHYLLFNDQGITLKQYWQIDYSEELIQSEDLLKEELLNTLKESIKLHLNSGVTVGTLLSGGLDSSTIVALGSQVSEKPINTFSIGFKEKTYDELNYARLVSQCFNTEHRELVISSDDMIDLKRQIIRGFDEPLADTSIIPSFLAFKLAKNHVNVVLCGDGGDELFGGYEAYIAQRMSHYYQWMPYSIKKYFMQIRPKDKKKGFVNRIRRFAQGEALSSDIKHFRWRIAFNSMDKHLLYSDSLKSELEGFDSYDIIRSQFKRAMSFSDLNQIQYVDIQTYLPDYGLVKTDRISNANSIQARYPFLDNKVIGFMANIPPHFKLRGFTTKYIMRKAMRRHLPSKVISKPKEGFSSPVKNWMRDELKPLMLELLSSQNIKKRGFFNEAYIQSLVKEHLSKRDDHSHRLWALLVFELWAQEWLDKF